jgi:hypothetical protein
MVFRVIKKMLLDCKFAGFSRHKADVRRTPVVYWQEIRRIYGGRSCRTTSIDDILLYLTRKLDVWSLLTWGKYKEDYSLSFYTSIANLMMIEEVDDGE